MNKEKLRSSWFVVLTGTLLLLACPGLHPVLAADPPGWKLAFSDGFDRDRLGHTWNPLKGSWKIADGWLTGREGEILCTVRFPGPQRLEYEARSAELSSVGDHRICDLSAFLAANESGYRGGYFIGFGSEHNTCSKILARGEQIARYDALVTPFRTHHVVCEWDGETLTHEIDGKVVHRETPENPLAGVPHQMIGFYMWENGYVDNVKVYTRTGEAILPTEKKVVIPAAVDPGLIANGSFEETHPGMEPPLPIRWFIQRWSRDDTVELVTDATEAHRGRRFLRVYAPGIHGLRMHNMRAGGIQMKPGTTYVIRLWARTSSGTSSVLTTEPGGEEFELTETWQLYTIQYAHPADEAPDMGLYFAVQGGPADVDDVSIVEDGKEEPVTAELAASWEGLEEVAFADAWTEPGWESRVRVVVQEVVGEAAENYPVSLQVKEILRSFILDSVRPEKIRIVDPSTDGGRQVPFAVVASDRNPFLSKDDQVLFLADCPARSRKTYFIYRRDSRREEGLFTPTDQLPDAVNVASDYPYRLAVDVNVSEKRCTVAARRVDDRIEAEVVGWTAAEATAELISPDGNQRLQVPLATAAPGHWRPTQTFRLPEGISPGVWRLEATFEEGSAKSEKVSTPFVIGNALWFGNTSKRIYEDDSPRYGRGEAHVAAAGNQWKPFQVALASEKGLRDVALRATDLKQQGGTGRLASEAIAIDCVEQALVTEGYRSGDIPDPLIPWQSENVRAGRQRVAYVTIKVPEGLAGGMYTGTMTAEDATGAVAELPVSLEVFPFSLPARRSFSPVISAGFGGGAFSPEAARAAPVRQTGRFRFARYYPIPHRRATLDMLRFLGERHMTPFYYSSNTAPYHIPWVYDPVKKTGELDFTLSEDGLDLADTLDVKYLFYNAENRIREHGGCMYQYYPEKKDSLYGWHGTELGRDMFYARMNPLAEYLRKRGWAERTLFYTNDEGFGRKTGPPLEGRDANELIAEYSRLIHEVDPGFKTFTADNAGGNWISPLKETDHFVGVMSKANQERFRAQGSVYWGIYNRNILLRKPLGIPRITGLDYYLRGWAHHFQLEAFHESTNPWINQNRYSHSGSKNGFFIVGGVVGQGFSHYVYPWPEWRSPWKEGLPTLVSSLRFEALRESIDDYEYMKMLSDTAGRLPADSPLRQRCAALLERAKAFVAKSNMGDDYRYGGSHSNMVVDGDELDALLRDIGRAIAEGIVIAE